MKTRKLAVVVLVMAVPAAILTSIVLRAPEVPKSEIPQSCEKIIHTVEVCSADYVKAAESLGLETYSNALNMVRMHQTMRTDIAVMYKVDPESTNNFCDLPSMQQEHMRAIDGMYFIAVQNGGVSRACHSAHDALTPTGSN